jgi:hypothetical protein
MDKYVFTTTKPDFKNNTPSIVKSIQYRCLICGYGHEYDNTWTDEKKAEVKAKVDAHHNEHFNITL